MTHLITNAIPQTYLVIGVLALAWLLTIRRRTDDTLFPPAATTELKGLAILLVVLSHIGYFLVSDQRFLAPLSNFAGIGVDLFFILSGYGLTISALQRPLPILQFYRKRLFKIYLPVLIACLLLLGLDYFFLNLSYPLKLTAKNLLGFFPQADLYQDLNSPLWYITPLLTYYLLFPLVFWRKYPLISAGILSALAWLFIRELPGLDLVSEGLVKMYKLHFLSFPIGMVLAWLFNRPLKLTPRWRYAGTIMFTAILAYTLTHTHVGEAWKREAAACITSALLFIGLFVAKPFNNRFLALIGTFSFEIYLFHWPLLYRYDFLYNRLPAGVATLLYLAILVGLGYVFQLLLNRPTKLTVGTNSPT